MNSVIQARIRTAVSAGEFGKALTLWETHAEQVADEIRAGTCSAADLAQVREMVEWTRGVAICTRAHAQRRIHAQLTKLHAAAVYGRPPR
jgi:hypothetical protein